MFALFERFTGCYRWRSLPSSSAYAPGSYDNNLQSSAQSRKCRVRGVCSNKRRSRSDRKVAEQRIVTLLGGCRACRVGPMPLLEDYWSVVHKRKSFEFSERSFSLLPIP